MARRGFTLIEVLVVIAIIGLLVAIAVPALMMVQNQAANTKCQTNLNQLGRALLAYETIQKAFPPALINPGSFCVGGACPDPPPRRIAPILDASQFPNDPNQRTLNTTGWTLILNNLEQENIYVKYNFERASAASSFNSGSVWPTAGDGSDNTTVTSMKIEWFVCPSDSTPYNGSFTDTANPNGPYVRTSAAPGNYVFSTGEYDERANTYGYYRSKRNEFLRKNPPVYLPPLGAFGINGATSINWLNQADGATKTILVGEAIRAKDSFPAPYGRPDQTNAGGFWGVGTLHAVTAQVYPIDANEAAGDPTDTNATPYATLYNDIDPKMFAINSKGANGKLPPPGVFSSYHGGGANFLFADGNVRFISESINMGVLYRLTTADAVVWPLWKGKPKNEQVDLPD